MTWYSLSHGTNGLLLAYGLTLIPLLAALIQRGVSVRGLLLAPFVAVPATAVGAIAGGVLAAVLPKTTASATWTAAIVGVGACVFVGYATGMYLARQRNAQDAHKRGTVLIPAQRPRMAAPGSVTLAGIEIPLLDETKHFKLIGTTGSGKSTAIRELLAGALERGDRAIIADPDGGYLARFYRPERGDMILNPFDTRSARWDLFGRRPPGASRSRSGSSARRSGRLGTAERALPYPPGSNAARSLTPWIATELSRVRTPDEFVDSNIAHAG